MKLIKKISGYSFLFILIGLLSIYLYMIQFQGLTKIINNEIAQKLSDKYNLKFNLGELDGSLFSGVTAKNITLYYQDSSSSYPIVFFLWINSNVHYLKI